MEGKDLIAAQARERRENADQTGSVAAGGKTC
jgi:hypothetical protein